MPKNISKIDINAPIEKIWDYLTKPALVKKWQYGSELSTDWNVGNEIRFKSEWEGKTFEQRGEVLEVIPNKKLKYSLFAPRPDLEDKPQNYFTMEYNLKEKEDGVVLLEIIQIDNRPGATQEEENNDENSILEDLKSQIES